MAWWAQRPFIAIVRVDERTVFTSSKADTVRSKHQDTTTGGHFSVGSMYVRRLCEICFLIIIIFKRNSPVNPLDILYK